MNEQLTKQPNNPLLNSTLPLNFPLALPSNLLSVHTTTKSLFFLNEKSEAARKKLEVNGTKEMKNLMESRADWLRDREEAKEQKTHRREALNKPLNLYSIYYGTDQPVANSKEPNKLSDHCIRREGHEKLLNKEVRSKLGVCKVKSSTQPFNDGAEKNLSSNTQTKHSAAKCSSKSVGMIEGYAGNTFKGRGKYF